MAAGVPQGLTAHEDTVGARGDNSEHIRRYKVNASRSRFSCERSSIADCAATLR